MFFFWNSFRLRNSVITTVMPIEISILGELFLEMASKKKKKYSRCWTLRRAQRENLQSVCALI